MRVYSKHSLINGTGAGEDLPPANQELHMSDTVPTWGYKGSEAKIFELKPGEALPSGWADRPGVAPQADPVTEAEKPKRKAKKPEVETEADDDQVIDGDSDAN